MLRAALFLLLAALPAAAADPFAGLKRLDRVVVTDNDGDSFRGIVRSVVRGRLSIQLEGREGVTGSIVFERAGVKSLEKSGRATEDELKAASEPPRPLPEGFAEPERVDPPPKVEPPPPRPVLEAFPPSEWSVARRDEIAAKDVYLRTADEREFLVRFDDWASALEQREREEGRALLERFPAAKGWGEETYARLRCVTAVIGRELTPEERYFVEKFRRWKAAWDATRK